MSVHYSEDFKKEVVKAYMTGDKSYIQLSAEYNIAKSTISQWVNKYQEECLYTTHSTTESNEAKEIRRLKQLLNEKDKEISFLKRAAAFFAKEIDQWYIDSSMIIKKSLVSDGYVSSSELALTATIIIKKGLRRNIINV